MICRGKACIELKTERPALEVLNYNQNVSMEEVTEGRGIVEALASRSIKEFGFPLPDNNL